jgi:probable HAF family extracellular repeat protein
VLTFALSLLQSSPISNANKPQQIPRLRWCNTKKNKMKTMQLVIVTCATLALAPLANAQRYHAFIWNSGGGMTDLGTLGGNTSYATGINDSGQVVGYSYLADDVTRHAFIWTASGGMVDLGTLPGGAWSQGENINASGEICGEAVDGSGIEVPFFWSPSTGFVIAPGPYADGSGAYAFGINDAGTVTGQAYLSHDILYGILWRTETGQIRSIPGLYSNFVVGYDINNRNHVAGNSLTSSWLWDAIVWVPGQGTVDIGEVPGASTTLAHGINDRDQVTGIGYIGSNTSAFYWSRPTGIVVMQTLGGTIGAGLHINRTGMIAGWSSNSSGQTHAALWNDYTSVPQDLGTLPGGTISYAYGVNSSGQVVGFSTVP